jgi:hypothetical protein
MGNTVGPQNASQGSFNITQSTATPIGFLSGRKISRLEFGAEGSELLKIAAKINTTQNPVFESPKSSLGFFQRNVTVQIGNNKYDINISSCAKRLGITREAVFDLAKTNQLENRLKTTAQHYNEIKNGFETDIKAKEVASKLADFIFTNEENIKNAADAHLKNNSELRIDTRIQARDNENFEIAFKDGHAYLVNPQKEKQGNIPATIMPQAVYDYLGLAKPPDTSKGGQFAQFAEELNRNKEKKSSENSPKSMLETMAAGFKSLISSSPEKAESQPQVSPQTSFPQFDLQIDSLSKNVAPLMKSLAQTELVKDTKPYEDIVRKTIEHLSTNSEAINKEVTASEKDPILLTSKATGLPRTIEVYKSGKVLIHLTKINKKNEQIDPTVGKGGFKRVHFALDITDAKLAAVIKVKNKREKDTIEEMKKEGEILQEFVGCENVVQMTGSLEVAKDGQNSITKPYSAASANSENGKMFLLQSFYNAGSLNSYCRGNVGDIEVKRKLAQDMLRGCAQVQERGYVHADIKPGNILIHSENGTISAHLADFGSAVKIEEKKLPSAQTKNYLSPEMLKSQFGKSQIDATLSKLDSWALGVTLYQFLMGGKWPYNQGLNRPATEDHIKKLPNRAETTLNLDGLKEPEKNLLKSLLAIDPNDRATPQDALDSYQRELSPPKK